MKFSNHCHFVGNLGKDPEAQYLPNGTKKVSFSLAVNMSYKGSDGGWVDKTTWVNLSAFGPVADRIMAALRKGMTAVVSATYETSESVGEDGKKRYFHNFNVTDFSPSKPLAGAVAEDAPSAFDTGDIPF